MVRRLPESQPLSALKAESQRPYYGSQILASRGIGAGLRQRAEITLRDLAPLAAAGVAFSPFLEIGAGSTQRSAALMNRYGAEGAATDISESSVRNSPYVLALLGCERGPLLVCCDAAHLPFQANTFQFAFCYRSLHHFPNPVPVAAELYRVLGRGGHLFLNDEPMDSPLKRLLRGRRHLARPLTRPQRLATRLGVARLFWDDSAGELALGMVEVRFDLWVWREALRPFAEVTVEISRRLRLRSDLYRPRLAALLSGLWGGNVWALCRKDEGEGVVECDLRERLMCLDCGGTALTRDGTSLTCGGCGREYPITGGVIRMLPRELETALYGETRAALGDSVVSRPDAG
ncbi:MAG: methyltransferase domain-containing protein [Anaerolineae bacterium]